MIKWLSEAHRKADQNKWLHARNNLYTIDNDCNDFTITKCLKSLYVIKFSTNWDSPKNPSWSVQEICAVVWTRCFSSQTYREHFIKPLKFYSITNNYFNTHLKTLYSTTIDPTHTTSNLTLQQTQPNIQWLGYGC